LRKPELLRKRLARSSEYHKTSELSSWSKRMSTLEFSRSRRA